MAGIKPGGGCDIVGLVKDVFDVSEQFVSNKDMKKRFGPEASTIVKTIFEKVYNLPMEQMSGVKLTAGNVRTFKSELARVELASKKGQLTSKFGSLFYTPESIVKSNPQLVKLHDNLHNVKLNYDGRIGRHKRSYERILDFAKRFMLEKEYGEQLNATLPMTTKATFKIKAASKKANKHEQLIEKLKIDVQNKVPGSTESMAKAIEAENKFYANQEGKVFNEILQTIEQKIPKLHAEASKAWFGDIKTGEKGKGELLREKLFKGSITREEYYTARKKALKPILSKEIKQEPLRNLTEEYVDLMDEMYSVTKNGVKAYVDALKAGMKNKYSNDKIDKIAKSIYEKILPDQVRGYYPHYRRVLSVDFMDNLMPRLQRVSEATTESFKLESASVDKVIDELSSYVTSHVNKRQIVDLGKKFDAQNEYSRNFLVNIKRYVDEVDRFNMIAHSDKYTRESLNAAKNLFKNGEPIDGFAKATVDMMVDLNARMKGGYGFENANAEAAMKTLLALEFTSKLGLNLRSGLKNATQMLLNTVEFGPIMISRSKKLYENSPELRTKVDLMMDEAGFLFADNMAPELVEGKIAGKSFLSKVKINNKEQLEFIKPSFFSGINDKVQGVAARSGKIMGKVENMNRKSTFRIAFAEMYQHLNNSSKYKNDLRNSGLTEAQVNAEVLKRSRNYALRKTTLLHFDYSDIAKASWLTKPTGRLLGQFQHYGVKFFEYNMNLAKNGKNDILAGEVLGTEAQKAYRMGLIYGLAPVIASAMTGLDFTNLVEHDSYNKIQKFWTLFTGDDEEVRKAYYGKGTLTQLPFIGAPVVSDAISIGNVLGFLNMEDEEKEKLITGWENYALASGDRKAYEIIKILNTSLSRAAYKTLPTLLEKGPGAALQYESGLYNTDYSKELKKKTFKGDPLNKPILPKDVLSALDALSGHIDNATKEEIIKNTKVKKQGMILTGKSALQ
tara:strand:+ start:18596 stop:21466 length:2871 start_codon:yes stop_codon:yes gene_type:complete